MPGSPIEVMVGAGKKKPGYDVGFEIPGIRLPDDLKVLKGTLIPPSGGEEPIELKAGTFPTFPEFLFIYKLEKICKIILRFGNRYLKLV